MQSRLRFWRQGICENMYLRLDSVVSEFNSAAPEGYNLHS